MHMQGIKARIQLGSFRRRYNGLAHNTKLAVMTGCMFLARNSLRISVKYIKLINEVQPYQGQTASLLCSLSASC